MFIQVKTRTLGDTGILLYRIYNTCFNNENILNIDLRYQNKTAYKYLLLKSKTLYVTTNSYQAGLLQNNTTTTRSILDSRKKKFEDELIGFHLALTVMKPIGQKTYPDSGQDFTLIAIDHFISGA